jgi:hypothetical protein
MPILSDLGWRFVAKVTFSVTVLVCLALAACGGDGAEGGARSGGDKTFEGDGFSFSYPGEWAEEEDFEARVQAGSEATSQVAVAPGHGRDVVLVEVGPVSVSISEGNLDKFKPEFARAVESLFQQAEGELTAGPVRVQVGGLPALRFEANGVTSQGVRTRSRLTLVFDGLTQYAVNCQFTPEGAEEIERGCDQILSSFRVEGGGGGEDNTFEGDGYSFTYPGEWVQGEPGEAAGQTGGEPLSEAAFAPEFEGSDNLLVQVYRLKLAVTEGNFDEASDEFATLIGEALRQADGDLTSGPTRVTVGGLPGLSFEGSLVNADGVHVRAWATVAFDGRTEYVLECEFTPERAEEMKRGCNQVLESFQVE